MSMSGEVLPYRFSPIIALLSGGLTLFTLFFSALRPLTRIKKMTPIQSVSAEPENKAPKKEKRREAPASPRSLAMAGLRRSRGRMLVTSLSAMVSVLLFVIVGGFTDAIANIEPVGMFDVELGLSDGNHTGLIPEALTHISKFIAVEPDMIESLANSENVEEMQFLRFGKVEADISPSLEERLRSFLAQETEYEWAQVREAYQSILDSGRIKPPFSPFPTSSASTLSCLGRTDASRFAMTERNCTTADTCCAFTRKRRSRSFRIFSFPPGRCFPQIA